MFKIQTQYAMPWEHLNLRLFVVGSCKYFTGVLGEIEEFGKLSEFWLVINETKKIWITEQNMPFKKLYPMYYGLYTVEVV